MVYTPYTGWKRGHDYHHRHSNNTVCTVPDTLLQECLAPKIARSLR